MVKDISSPIQQNRLLGRGGENSARPPECDARPEAHVFDVFSWLVNVVKNKK